MNIGGVDNAAIFEYQVIDVISNSANFYDVDCGYLNMVENCETVRGQADGMEIDFRFLTDKLLANKILIVLVVILSIITSYFISNLLPDVYKSEALLMESDYSGATVGAGGIAGEFSGLAALAGVNLGGDTTKQQLAVEVLKSRKFVKYFVDKYQLQVPILAAKGWDKSVDALLLDNSIYDSVTGLWGDKDWIGEGKPKDYKIYEEFMKILAIDVDSKTGFTRVAVKYYSPALARDWVSSLVDEVNDVLRGRDIAEFEKNIKYLSDELNKTSLSSMQSVFYSLIEEQVKKMMFAKTKNEYVFSVIDPPVVVDQPVSPNRLLIILIGLFAGVLVTLIYIFYIQK